MEHIDPSHFVTLSFFIFIGIVIRKRFFNLGALLDGQINTIKEEIDIATRNREAAYDHLKETESELEGVDLKIADIIEKGRIACETLAHSMRDEVATEIALKQSQYAVRAKHLEEHFQKIYQEQLIMHIFKNLRSHLNMNTHQKKGDFFYEQQLQHSLELLGSVKNAF